MQWMEEEERKEYRQAPYPCEESPFYGPNHSELCVSQLGLCDVGMSEPRAGLGYANSPFQHFKC